MYLKVDSKLLLFFGIAISLMSCHKKSSSNPPTPIIQTTSFVSSEISVSDITPSLLIQRFGSSLLHFRSNGEFENAGCLGPCTLILQPPMLGHYEIQNNGVLNIAMENADQLYGTVNPAEDILFTKSSLIATLPGLGPTFQMAVSATSFPESEIPSFDGHYSFLGIRIPSILGLPDTTAPIQALRGSMTMIQTESFGGSFFVTAEITQNALIGMQGTFSIGADLQIIFSLDGFASEIWAGSFAPSGLLLLTDKSSTDDGYVGSYYAIPDSNFEGGNSFVFEGNYRVARMQFRKESVNLGAIGRIFGSYRTFEDNGTFSDFCDSQFECAGVNLNVPYELNALGEITLFDPLLEHQVANGAVTPDLGAFVAIEQPPSLSAALPQEVSLIVGIRLVP